jgi:tetratricopeptide (TPR) repeat protein
MRVPVSTFLFLFLTLSGTGTAAAPESAELYRASYKAEARGDYVDALAKVNQIRKSAGASYFLALRTGWLAYLAGDYAGAEVSYREAIGANSKAIEAKVGLTLVLFVAKKWRDLMNLCKEILDEGGGLPTVRARLAAAYYNLGALREAAQAYRKLSDEYPGELDYQTGLGWALLRLGKRADARRIFEGVLAVSPDNASAAQGLATR